MIGRECLLTSPFRLTANYSRELADYVSCRTLFTETQRSELIFFFFCDEQIIYVVRLVERLGSGRLDLDLSASLSID